MNSYWNERETVELLEELVNTASPSGYTSAIMKKMGDYLKQLGIEVIYLTPIFTSSSDHKYNTDDYLEIDKDFGTIQDFKDLVNECHNNQIKIKYFDYDFVVTVNDDSFTIEHLK
mgnify:CR=1 FL=1